MAKPKISINDDEKVNEIPTESSDRLSEISKIKIMFKWFMDDAPCVKGIIQDNYIPSLINALNRITNIRSRICRKFDKKHKSTSCLYDIIKEIDCSDNDRLIMFSLYGLSITELTVYEMFCDRDKMSLIEFRNNIDNLLYEIIKQCD